MPDPVSFPAGTFVIPAAQTGRAALIDVLEIRAPDEKRLWPDGPYLRRYDSAAYTLPQMLGVDVVRVDTEFDAQLEPLDGPATAPSPGTVATADAWYALDARVLASYQAVNVMLAEGIEVHRAMGTTRSGGKEMAPGAFLVPASARDAVVRASTDLRVPVVADPVVDGGTVQIDAARVGLFKPWQPSMDEGWTRLIFDDFGIPYESLDNAAIKAGDLGASLDVIIIPAQISLDTLIDGRDPEETPEPYAGGIGEEGLAALREFVEGGGTLLTIERGDAVAVEKFGVPVRDTLDGLSREEFFYSASLVNLNVDVTEPLGWGMRPDAQGFFGGGRAYAPADWLEASERVNVVATYEDEGRVLASGLMVGDEHLAGKGAVLEVTMGDGRIVLYGFRVQHRAQTRGTFPLLFNPLYVER